MPDELFQLKIEETDTSLKSWKSDTSHIELSLKSTISNLSYAKGTSYLKFNVDDQIKSYKLGRQSCPKPCNKIK